MIATTKFALFGFVGFCALLGYNAMFEGKVVSDLKLRYQPDQQLQKPHHEQQLQQSNAAILALQQQLQQKDLLHHHHHHHHQDGQGQNGTTTTTVATTGSSGGSNNRILVDASHPLFVLGLPNHLELALPRYFECGGNVSVDNNKLGRQWTTLPIRGKHIKHPSLDRWEIGRYMKDTLLHKRKRRPKLSLVDGIKPKFEVWMDLQFLQAPEYGRDGKLSKPADCFDLVLFPGALQALEQSFPRGATILNVVRDPIEWTKTLGPNYPKMWNEWCNPSHGDNAFPTHAEINGSSSSSQRAMMGFYLEYQHKLRSFAKDHPRWNYIEIDMDKQQQQDDNTAIQLEQRLGIDAQCWINSTRGNIRHLTPADPNIPSLLQDQPRPNSVGWPMLVTALPKAGTSTLHDYFRCGMGDWATAHQWTTKPVEPYPTTTIGECMIDNTNHNDEIDNLLLRNASAAVVRHRSFLEGCGNQLVWSDTGVLRRSPRREKRKCYFPFLHRNGLERFYESYPYGTLLNTVRNTSNWVDSAFRWNKLPERWIGAKCQNMPTSSTVQEWEHWYDQVQTTIRQFAMDHPTLTYIEIPLNHQTGDILQDIFSFPQQCWGHANVNFKNPVAAVNNNSTSKTTTTNADTTAVVVTNATTNSSSTLSSSNTTTTKTTTTTATSAAAATAAANAEAIVANRTNFENVSAATG